MKYFLLCFSFCFCVSLYDPQTLFTYKNKNYTDVDFFEQIFKDDWDVFDQQKKLSLFEDYLKKELSVLASQKNGVDLIPSTQIKLQEKFNALLINNTYEHFVARPLIDVDVVEKNIDFLSLKAEAYHLLIGFEGSVQNTDATLSQAGAQALADSLYLLINNKKEDIVDVFSYYAETYSIDPSAKTNRGFLGWVPWGRTVMSFQEPLFNLNIGVVSQPVLTEYGYHLILKTKQDFSSHYYYNKRNYLDLAWKVAQNTLSFDMLKKTATEYDSLILKDSGFAFNETLVDSLFKYIDKQQAVGVSGNKNLLLSWLRDLKDFGVLFTENQKGFGVGWFVDKLEKTPASRIPPISSVENLKLSIRSLFLQDLVLAVGLENKIDTTTSFNKDFTNNRRALLYNEYVSFLLNSVPSPDSTDVIRMYNQGVFNKDFVKPFRVVFSEIRVFDEIVIDSVFNLIKNGAVFDSLLVGFGGSIKEPVSSGANTPLSQAAFSLDVGGLSGIINNNNGSFSIIKVERFLEEEPFSLDLVYSQIERKIISEKQEEIKSNLLNILLKDLDVKINYGVLGL